MITLANEAYLVGFAEGLRPDKKLTVSQWSDEHRMLSATASAEPGRWRTNRVPYTREIMDCLSPDSPYEEVVFMKGAQVAGTESGNNWLGFIIAHSPGPTMLVLPTSETGKRTSKQRIAPMLEDTPCLREKVNSNRSRDSGNTLLVKEFPGGVLVITGANSAVGLRSMPIRNLFMDEIDAYPNDVDGEGDPISLATKRTNTFKRTRKIFKCSTPLIKELSRIEKAYDGGDQRRYYVPCTECGHKQPIAWAQLNWEKDSTGKHLPDTVKFACKECGSLIAEHNKTWMLENGEWIAEGESNGRVASFHLSALYSPLGWYSWSDAVREFLDAKDDQALLQAWVNTVLGETFEEGGERPSNDALIARREHYKAEIPAGACVLTAGVDVQDDRLECEVFGYGPGEESWPIDLRVIYGDPDQPEVWKALDDVLGSTYRHENGSLMSIAATCIDSGYKATTVYDYVKSRQRTYRVYAIKGKEGGTMPMVSAPSKKKQGVSKRPVDLFILGVDVIKSLVYRRLKITEVGPGYCHFPLAFASNSECDEEYFLQLTAEKVVTRYDRGWPKNVWIKMRPRNEKLDIRVYGYAALKLLNPVWDALAKRVERKEENTEEKKPEKNTENIRSVRQTSQRPKRRGFVNKYKH